MFLFILESIGTSELLLVGVIALIFLGPRRMPQIARQIGKMMAEFRGTANEFKETWQKEVDFEDEAKSLDLNAIEDEVSSVPRTKSLSPSETIDMPEPLIKEVDPAALDRLREQALQPTPEDTEPNSTHADETSAVPVAANDKRNWL